MHAKPIWILTAASTLLASCATQPVTLAPVGPRPLAWKQVVPESGTGRLQVYTETDEYEYDHDVPFFPHRDYQIYRNDGKLLKRVWNAQNHEDETPAIVELPPGDYVVKADAEFVGTVLVPVVIKPHRLTKVILQPGWKPPVNRADADLVRSPKGYYVGWSAGNQ